MSTPLPHTPHNTHIWYLSVGLASVNDDAVNTRFSLREVESQGTVVSCGCHGWRSKYIIFLRREQLPRTTSLSVYMLRNPGGRYKVNTLLSLEVPTPTIKSNNRRRHPYARSSASKLVLSSMQFTFHATSPTPHGASRLVQGKPSWWHVLLPAS